MTVATFPTLPPPNFDAEPTLSIPAMLIAQRVRDYITLGAGSSERSQQRAIGSSELGSSCLRRLAYRANGISAVNFPDPLRAVVGIGIHAALADIFNRLNALSGSSRFLVEHPTVYQDIPGTVDLFDRATGLVIDWKTSTASRIKGYRADGPSRLHVVQVQTYAAGLTEQGENVESVALVYVPTDSDLSDLWVWTAPADAEMSKVAMAKWQEFTFTAPSSVPATPGTYCNWCPNHRAGSRNLDRACPGKES